MSWSGRQDEASFSRLVSEATPKMLRTAFLMTYDLAEAEDLVQETWARVAKRWRRVGALDNPAAYARRVLVNAAIDGQPARGRRRIELGGPLSRLGNDPADLSTGDALSAIEHHDALAGALANLTARQRAVLVLRYFDDLSEQQTAEAMGCSPGTVKSTASRALAQLRTAFSTDLTASDSTTKGAS